MPATLDHLIVSVRDAAASACFYRDVLGFTHEGRRGPFEVVRVSRELTLDLMQRPPGEALHLAFHLDRAAFDAVREKLAARGIAWGAGPFDRDGSMAANDYGARGNALALYFYGPDGHNLEIRTAV
jgi:catechol 2,3-dioxygenase-like lactoylglutathione lyase family enzyme